MNQLTLIQDHDLGAHIEVFDRMGEETHYIDLRHVAGISVGPGDQLHLRYNAGIQTLNGVAASDAEHVVNKWLMLEWVEDLSKKRVG
tara:strand:+ start:501 stop:761 length:261 start_codon:yes stop_codon:yes gene_type:complete